MSSSSICFFPFHASLFTSFSFFYFSPFLCIPLSSSSVLVRLQCFFLLFLLFLYAFQSSLFYFFCFSMPSIPRFSSMSIYKSLLLGYSIRLTYFWRADWRKEDHCCYRLGSREHVKRGGVKSGEAMRHVKGSEALPVRVASGQVVRSGETTYWRQVVTGQVNRCVASSVGVRSSEAMRRDKLLRLGNWRFASADGIRSRPQFKALGKRKATHS